MTENIPIVTVDLMRPKEKGSSCNNWVDGILRYLRLQTGQYYASAWIPTSLSWNEIFEKRGGKTGKHNRAEYKRALEKGYYCESFLPKDHIQDIFEINHSKAERQERPMDIWYTHSVEQLTKNFATTTMWGSECPQHWENWYGVFTKEKKLVGFIHMMRAGQYCGYSSILGHAGYWNDEIMLFLHLYIQKMIRETNDEHFKGILGMAYYLWESGTPYLKFWKEKAGFKKYHISWIDNQPTWSENYAQDKHQAHPHP